MLAATRLRVLTLGVLLPAGFPRTAACDDLSQAYRSVSERNREFSRRPHAAAAHPGLSRSCADALASGLARPEAAAAGRNAITESLVFYAGTEHARDSASEWLGRLLAYAPDEAVAGLLESRPVFLVLPYEKGIHGDSYRRDGLITPALHSSLRGGRTPDGRPWDETWGGANIPLADGRTLGFTSVDENGTLPQRSFVHEWNHLLHQAAEGRSTEFASRLDRVYADEPSREGLFPGDGAGMRYYKSDRKEFLSGVAEMWFGAFQAAADRDADWVCSRSPEAARLAAYLYGPPGPLPAFRAGLGAPAAP